MLKGIDVNLTMDLSLKAIFGNEGQQGLTINSSFLPLSIEYWFRCMDLDGDGVISMYEMEYFYDEQMQKMESLGIEKLPFEDCLCQVIICCKLLSTVQFAYSEVPGTNNFDYGKFDRFIISSKTRRNKTYVRRYLNYLHVFCYQF